jgi:hypothetical protein
VLGVDLLGREQRIHPERACLVGDDRHEALAEVGVLEQFLQQPHERHRGRDVVLARALPQLVVVARLGQRDRVHPHAPLGDRAAEFAPPLHHVLDLLGIRARVVVGRQVALELGVGDVHVEPVPEGLQRLDRQLLHLVGRVARLEVRPQRPALDRLREDHGRLPGVLDGRLVGRVHLRVVVAAAIEHRQVLGAQAGLGEDALELGRVEEVLLDVVAVRDRVRLELPVGRLVHLADQLAVHVEREQLVPLVAPQDLDDVPAGAAEDALELLDDLAVAAHRPVEPLQVAVHDPDQVVELGAPGEAQRPQRLGLVHLAVADERPDARPGGVDDAPMQQVAVEAGLVDRVDRAEAHRDRRELPELGHEPGMGVAGQPLAPVVGRAALLAEQVELLLGQPALEVRAGVDAGRGMTLEEDLVAEAVGLAAEEVVEADLVEARGRRIRRDVPADPDLGPVRAADHDRGVPPDVRADPPLDVLVTGELRLALGRDRVDVVGRPQRRDADLLRPRTLEHLEDQVARPGAPLALDDLVQRREPLTGLVGIDVG